MLEAMLENVTFEKKFYSNRLILLVFFGSDDFFCLFSHQPRICELRDGGHIGSHDGPFGLLRF